MGVIMDIQFGMIIMAMLYIIAIITILGLEIHTLILAIKVLKIYIKNNS